MTERPKSWEIKNMRYYRIHILVLLALGIYVCLEWMRTPSSPPTALRLPAPANHHPIPDSPVQVPVRVLDSATKMAPEKIAEIRTRLYSDSGIQQFMKTWQANEKAASRFLPTHNRSGREVLVLIPPVSAQDKAGVLNAISNLVKERFGSEPREVRETMRKELLEWADPSEWERVVQISYASSFDNQFESLQGRWFDVESSKNFKDEAYYIDYGKILKDGLMNKEKLLSRFGHFFSVQTEPANP